MSGIFEHLSAFDEEAQVATRQAIAVANKRFNDTFAGFLRQASTKKEFESRLALVDTDINNMVADVANEYGGDAEKIAAAIKASMTYTATCDCDGNCKGECSCGGCDSCKCASKKTANVLCDNCGDEGCEHCTGDPEASKTSAEKRPERLKAQDEIQLADEHSQVSPWLKKQIQDEDQEDGGNLRNKEATIDSQPIVNSVPLAKAPGYTAGGESIEQTLENAPSAVGTGVLSSAHKVEKKDDKFYVTEKGEGEVAGPFDSQEDAYARANELNDLENLETEETHKEGSITPAMAKALELKHAKDNWVNEGDTVAEDGETKKVEDIEQEGGEKVVKLDDGSTEDIDNVKVAAKPETGDKTEERESLPKGNEDALGGPSPKIDKKKWVPNATNPDGNLEPIDTEGNNSPVPTRQMDIKQKPDYQNDDPWENDNNVWEREQLPTAKEDEAGFETTRNITQPSKAAETFPDKGQTNPVTREALASMEKSASFREFLKDIGMDGSRFRNLADEQKSRLWDIYNNYDMPKFTEEEGLNVPLRGEDELAPDAGLEPQIDDIPVDEPVIDESPVEDLIEEPLEEPVEEETIIEETPEDIEQIIEREDKEGDRVEVIDEGDEEVDLLTDEELENLDDFEEIDPFENVEDMDDDEISRLIRDYEEDSDDEDRY